MSSPLKPHWVRPSHPDIQEVIVTGNEAEFTTKSISRVSLPPFALFAKLDFPPCTEATEVTYATVQMGRNKHLNLNSDLLYINHSCEPSLIFDTGNMNVIAGPKGLQVGEELTFFYPSTEWSMAQPFDCLCGKPTCRGRISGAGDMTDEQLQGLWLNGHIMELLEERRRKSNGTASENGGAAEASLEEATSKSDHSSSNNTLLPETPSEIESADQTAQALRDALQHAEKVVEAARHALVSYVQTIQHHKATNANGGSKIEFVAADADIKGAADGAQRRGPTSRELSGEMGGDTTIAV